jgi:hypothetical protein
VNYWTTWKRWSKENSELKSLQKGLDTAQEFRDLKLAEAKTKSLDEYEMQQIFAEAHSEYYVYSDQIEVIRTKRLVRKAIRYEVPIPGQHKDNDHVYWERASGTGVKYLTVEGSMQVRREIATEIDILQKPWLNWLAIVISVVGLAIAVAAFFN